MSESESVVKTVYWPDLSRFGAALTVSFNPSLARNFLKLTIVDRKQFALHSGLNCDLHQTMRDAGYSYAASESKSQNLAAYDQSQRRGLSIEETEKTAGAALNALAFYSSSMLIKKEIITQFVPSIVDADFKQIPISDIKHFDYQYLDKRLAGVLVEQQQRMRDSEAGVYFTTPLDRALLTSLAKSEIGINELLGFRDFPPEHVVKRVALVNGLESFGRFSPVPAIEKLMVGQSLGLDGTPLKAPRLPATILAYPTFDEAVAANGGDVESIERVQLPDAVPLGFDYPSRRLLILKDVRFTEAPNLLRLQDANDVPQNVQMHWDYLAQAESLLTAYKTAASDGLLLEANWGDEATFAKVENQFSAIKDVMHAMSKLTGKRTDFVEHVDLAVHTALRPALFVEYFPKDFLHFLGQFRSRLYPAMVEAKATLLADRVVQKGVRAAAESVRVAAVEPTSRREDAGQKIGGARKDYAMRSLLLSEIASLTQREMTEVVTKNNVWPALDLAAMQESGVAPEVAYLIKEWRHALPVNPLRGGFNVRQYDLVRRAEGDLNEEMSVNFVRAVSMVRDAFADVKTSVELLHAIYALRKSAGLAISLRGAGQRPVYTGGESGSAEFADGAGYRFYRKTLPGIVVRDGSIVESYDLSVAYAQARAKTGSKWDWAVSAKSRKGDAEVTAEEKQKEAKPEPVIPHLDRVSRTGPNYRDGKDADEMMLMDVFGFRGVEYGTWLPQAERQVVLNHAFDGFMDLSTALGMPPKAMSLGGELAIAFGARGTGGKGAAVAHFEPGRNVINLTRLKGAGFLAHEWGHAFDYWLSKVSGVSATRPVSEMVDVPNSRLPNAVNRFTEALNQARTRPMTREDVAARLMQTDDKKNKHVNIVDHARQCFVNWIAMLDRKLPDDKRSGVFKAFAVKCLDDQLEDVARLEEFGVKRMRDVDGFVRGLTTALDTQIGKEWRERGTDLRYPVRVADWLQKRVLSFESRLSKFQPGSHTTDSRFMSDAQYYDGFRSKAYWSTRVETFARAFETWVQDRVQGAGTTSEYLVFGRDDNMAESYSIYPRGTERVANAQKFAALFDECRPELLVKLRLDGEPHHNVPQETATYAMP